MKQFGWAWVAVLIVNAFGCGGGSSSSANSSSPTGGASDPKPGKTEDASASVKKVRDEFMANCAQALPGATDYCQCSWDVFRGIFSESDMQASEKEPSTVRKMSQYKEKLPGACGAKVPEPIVHDKFMEGCTSKGKELGAYCECGWKEIRKTLSVADIAIGDAATSARISAATKTMAKTCSAQLPEPVAHAAFVDACSHEDPAAQKFCDCAWKTLRASNSAAEVFAGAADIDAAKPKITAACGKLRPSQQQDKAP